MAQNPTHIIRVTLRRARAPWFPQTPDELKPAALPIPNLSDTSPRTEFVEVESLFVSSQKDSRVSKPTITQRAFRARMVADFANQKHHGYAITDMSQIQVRIGIFTRKRP